MTESRHRTRRQPNKQVSFAPRDENGSRRLQGGAALDAEQLTPSPPVDKRETAPLSFCILRPFSGIGVDRSSTTRKLGNRSTYMRHCRRKATALRMFVVRS